MVETFHISSLHMLKQNAPLHSAAIKQPQNDNCRRAAGCVEATAQTSSAPYSPHECQKDNAATGNMLPHYLLMCVRRASKNGVGGEV
jgi:hypothetical protein